MGGVLSLKSMEAVPSIILSGAGGEVGAMIVRGVSSLVMSRYETLVMSRYETQEGLDVILYSLQHEVNKIKSAINVARGRRITDQQLLDWLAQIINAAYCGEYYYRTSKNWSSLPPMIAGTEGTGNLLIDPISRPTKRQRMLAATEGTGNLLIDPISRPTKRQRMLAGTEGTGNLLIDPISRPTKHQRTIRTLLFDNYEHRELHDALKMLKSIDIHEFLLMVNARPERPMKSYLYMEPNKFVNRCKERDEVMKFLFEPSMAGENNVDVLPIVGARGIGKTTLALHCFYDPKVQNQFSLKIYIPHSTIRYSSEKLSPYPPSIFQTILKELNNTGITNFDENTLLAMLKQNLSSERVLLVMDDVRYIDSEVWNALLDCLRCAKQGSKVILTSSSWEYAMDKSIRDVGTVKPMMIEGFSEDEYMLFFKEHAFGSADAEDHPELAKMGEEIAKKVNGSIWGAKILGEILRDNLNAPFWSIFLQDGFLSSQFLVHRKDLEPVTQTICQLLPKRLRVVGVGPLINGGSGVLPGNFRELMVLNPKYWTPVINERKNSLVKLLVTKHFNLRESIDLYAYCELTGDESDLVKKKQEGADVQLRPNHVPVQVDLVMQEWARIPLPVPTEDMLVLDDARTSFVQWPKSQIILDQTRKNLLGDDVNSTEEMMSPVRRDKEKVVGVDALESLDRPLLTEEEYSRLPRDLRDLHDCLMKAPEGMTDIIIPVPPGMFLHEGWDVVLSFKDFKDFLHASSSNKWLDVGLITIFLMKLVRNCDEMVEKKNLCTFMDPGKLNTTALKFSADTSTQYLCSMMHHANAEEKKFILVPYHQSKHWCLIVIVPTENMIVIMDSSKPKGHIPIEKCKDIFPFVKEAFMQYIKEGGLQSTRQKNKLNWKWFPCPQQLEGWECGYYTMIYMFDFIERIQFDFPKAYGPKEKCYSKEQIDDVRCMWARWFQLEFCNAKYGFV